MAGTDLAAHAVVGLADIVRLVNRLPHFAGEAVLPGSAHFLIPHLHGLPAGGAVDQTVEQIIKGAGIPLNGRPAVNEFLHLFPFLRRHNRLMAALNDLPFLTGDNVIGVGADAFLMRPKDQMCALIEWISQDVTDSGSAPEIIVGVKLRVGFDMGDWDFFFHQTFGNPHAAQPVKGIVIDFADDWRCLRLNIFYQSVCRRICRSF